MPHQSCMTMSPVAALPKMHSDKGLDADAYNFGAQNPVLSQSMKRMEGRSCSEMDSNASEETTMEPVTCHFVSPSASHTPLLPRIDHLHVLLDSLQDQMTTPPHSTLKCEETAFQEGCKPISWVVDEIQAKGTILDRITTLEDRVTKIAEEMERRKECINVMEGVRLHLKGSSGCDIFVEENKVGVTPTLPCESVEKGLHEQFSRQVLQALDNPKDERTVVEKEKEERKGRKGKLRRMLPDCIRRPSTV